MVALQFGTGDGAIIGVEMSDHCHHGDISKAKHVIIKGSQVQAINHGEELFLGFLLNHSGYGKFLDGGIVEMDVFLSGCHIGTCSMNRDQSGMHC